MANNWRYSTGQRPYTVRVAERPAKQFMVYAYWQPLGASFPVNVSTGIRLRDTKGRIVESRRARCIVLADALANANAGGATDEELREIIRKGAMPRSPVTSARARAPERTLRTVLDEVYGPSFRDLDRATARAQAAAPRPDKRRWTEHRRDDRNNADIVLQLLGDRPWAGLAESWYHELWRAYAASLVASGSRVTGQRQAQKLIRVLSRAVRRMHRHGSPLILPETRELKEDLFGEWPTELPPAHSRERRRAELRYFDEEVANIMGALEHPHVVKSVDIRLVIALRVGAERRLGQVLRCRWRDLQRTLLYGELLTVLWVPGTKKKGSGPILLTAEEDKSLNKLYRKGATPDSFIFAGGHLDAPINSPSRAAPVSTSNLTRDFQALEKFAGVKHSKGRGWYGLRRSLVDLLQTVSPQSLPNNPLVRTAVGRDLVSGHTPERIREGVYLNPASVNMLRLVRELRLAGRMKAREEREVRTRRNMQQVP